MVTREDLESFLIRMELDYEEVDDGMYLINSHNGGPPIVLHHSDPLLLVRVKIMDLPEGDHMGELYRTLLTFNATDVVHGAYGIEEGELILTDTMELETLDMTEIQASLESMQMAVSSHLEKIRSLAGVEGGGAGAGSDGADDDSSEAGSEG